MSDILDNARILLFHPKNKSKRDRIEYETDEGKLCSVCGEKAGYRLSRTPLWLCEKHYSQLLNRSIWIFVERYLIGSDALGTLYLNYNGKKINFEILFTEKTMRDIQYYFRELGFKNCKIDKEVFLTAVRNCDGVAYADWIDDKLVAFLVPLHDCLITKQEWDEIKARVIQKGLLKKVAINSKSPDYDF